MSLPKLYNFNTPNDYFLVCKELTFNNPPKPIQSNISHESVSNFVNYVPLPFYKHCNTKWILIQNALNTIQNCSNLTPKKLFVRNYLIKKMY